MGRQMYVNTYGDDDEDMLDEDENDPDYYPSDNSSQDANDSTMDRCKYIDNYYDELNHLHNLLLNEGRELMGSAFLQLCTFSNFANFCYKLTTPTSD